MLGIGGINVEVVKEGRQECSPHGPSAGREGSHRRPKRMQLDVVRLYAISKLRGFAPPESNEGQARETAREYIDRESHMSGGSATC